MSFDRFPSDSNFSMRKLNLESKFENDFMDELKRHDINLSIIFHVEPIFFYLYFISLFSFRMRLILSK